MSRFLVFFISVFYVAVGQPPRTRDCQSGIWDLALAQFLWWELERSRCNVLILKELQWWDCPVPPEGQTGARSLGGKGGHVLTPHVFLQGTFRAAMRDFTASADLFFNMVLAYRSPNCKMKRACVCVCVSE